MQTMKSYCQRVTASSMHAGDIQLLAKLIMKIP